MRIETSCSARSALTRRAMRIVMACVIAVAGLAAAASVAPAAEREQDGPGAGSRATRVALHEQSLPPEDLSSPAASPAASPSASPVPPAGSQSQGGAGGAAR